jgi:hypothetical protein
MAGDKILLFNILISNREGTRNAYKYFVGRSERQCSGVHEAAVGGAHHVSSRRRVVRIASDET